MYFASILPVCIRFHAASKRSVTALTFTDWQPQLMLPSRCESGGASASVTAAIERQMKLDFWKRPPWHRYVTQVRGVLDKWAVWTPGSNVSPGDFGVISDKRFLRLGSVFDCRAEPPNIKPPSLTLDMLEFGHLTGLQGAQMPS
jgi:hypothetical protein